MPTAAEIQTQIDAIDAKLSAGVTSVQHNGRSVSYDLDQLQQQRDKLTRRLSAMFSSRFSRVVFKNAI